MRMEGIRMRALSLVLFKWYKRIINFVCSFVRTPHAACASCAVHTYVYARLSDLSRDISYARTHREECARSSGNGGSLTHVRNILPAQLCPPAASISVRTRCARRHIMCDARHKPEAVYFTSVCVSVRAPCGPEGGSRRHAARAPPICIRNTEI